MLSRNFRLQKVGDADWLNRHYNFSRVAEAIDELVILDASRDRANAERFFSAVEAVTEGCFVPLALGGGVKDVGSARRMMESGADKLVVNTALEACPQLIAELSEVYGSQCVVVSIDYKLRDNSFDVYVDRGRVSAGYDICTAIRNAAKFGAGELYLTSMDRDGTGQGFCMDVLAQIPEDITLPVVMSGGAGNYNHLVEGLSHPRVDGVSTANLFNFIGDGLPRAREHLINAGIPLAQW